MDQAAAFWAVYGALRASHAKVTDTAMRRVVEDDPIPERRHHIQRALKTSSSSADAEEWVPTAVACLNSIMETHNVRVPSELESIWSHLNSEYLDSYQKKQVDGLPFFLDEPAIARYLKNVHPLLSAKELVSSYEGCWRLFRPSTVENGDLQWNRAFINIKPMSVLRNKHREVPEFSMYSRTENSTEGFPWRGSLYASNSNLFLIGARTVPEMACLLTWRHVTDLANRGHVNRIGAGLMIIASTAGRPIATAFFAKYIEDSVNLDDEQYVSLRTDERAQVGSFTREALSDLVTDADVEELQQLRRGDLALSL